MKKVLTLVISLVLIISLAITPAFATENNDASVYAGTYVLAEDERIEISSVKVEQGKVAKFYLIFSEEAGIFLQYGNFISHVNDYVYLGDELYVSLQDIVEAFEAFEGIHNSVDCFVSTSRFELGDTIGK